MAANAGAVGVPTKTPAAGTTFDPALAAAKIVGVRYRDLDRGSNKQTIVFTIQLGSTTMDFEKEFTFKDSYYKTLLDAIKLGVGTDSRDSLKNYVADHNVASGIIPSSPEAADKSHSITNEDITQRVRGVAGINGHIVLGDQVTPDE